VQLVADRRPPERRLPSGAHGNSGVPNDSAKTISSTGERVSFARNGRG
jgi:hypothetical protein